MYVHSFHRVCSFCCFHSTSKKISILDDVVLHLSWRARIALGIKEARFASGSLDTFQAQQMSLLKLYRWQLVVETMLAFWAVEPIAVIERISACLLLGALDLSPDLRPFQQVAKAFSYRVVMAVSTLTHACQASCWLSGNSASHGCWTGHPGLSE